MKNIFQAFLSSPFFNFVKKWYIVILIITVLAVGVVSSLLVMNKTAFAQDTVVRNYLESIGIVESADDLVEAENESSETEESSSSDTEENSESTDTNTEETEWDEDAVDDDLGHTETEDISKPDVNYPTLQKVTDGLGHTQTGSTARGNVSNWEYQTIQEGNTLRFVVTSDNPNGSTLSYRFEYQAPNSSFKLVRSWGTSNTVVWTVPASAVGKWSVIKAMVKDSDDELRFGNCDDYTFLTYAVNPAVDPTTLYPWINQVSDNMGNINTNSWGGDNSGDWSDGLPHTVAAGGTITFSVGATDPNGDSLKYRFLYQPEGGSFSTLRSWSTSNTFSWTVPTSLVDTQIVFYIGIKDSDSYIQFGEDDDYTYMIYTVE